MTRSSLCFLTHAAAGAAVSLAASAAADPSAFIVTETIALSHTDNDGRPPFSLFSRPIISDAGTVAFEGFYARSVGADFDAGVWAWDDGELRLVAWEGDPSGEFASFEPPQLTPGGAILLLATNVSRKEVLWQETAGELRRIIGEGDSDWWGDLGFPGFLSTPIVGPDFCSFPGDAELDYFAMWSTRWGELDLIVPEGWRLPGTHWDHGEVRDLASNAAGRHAFTIRHAALPYADGIWRESSSFLDFLVMSGDPEPLEPNFTFTSFKWLSHEGGATAFYGRIDDDDLDEWRHGLWAYSDGSLQRLALRYEESPALPGSEISFLGHPTAVDGGAITFTAALSANDEIDESNNAAVWRGAPGDLQIVMREGDHIPGLPADVVIRDFQSVAVGETYAALYVTLFGYTVGDNDRALILIDADGDAHLITRVGDKFDVSQDGSDLRSVRSIGLLPADPERGRSPLSAGGTVAFSLDFADGTSGVFTARLVTVCSGDIDGDGATGQSDLGLLLASYELDPDDPFFNPAADLDGDGQVGQPDLGILLADYECDADL